MQGNTGNKYHRLIYGLKQTNQQFTKITIDVYCVITAYNVTRPGLQHCIKKCLCAGLRDKGSELQDLVEARDALDRAIEDDERDAKQSNVGPVE